MNFFILHFSIILFRWCKYFSLFLSICPESLLDLMFSLKNLILHVRVYVRVCVCVRACVCVYVYVFITLIVTWIVIIQKVIISTCTTQYPVLTKFQKFINWKYKSFLLYMMQIFTCLNFFYISSSIKMLYTLKHW